MFDQFIADASWLYNVPIPWIQAVIQVESSWNSNAYRPEPQINDASYGLMQLLLRTARGLGYTGTGDGLFDPEINIQLGSKLLGQLRSSYGDDFRRVYSAYNSGNPDLWQTSSEVRRNVDRAMAALATYETADNGGTGNGTVQQAGLGAIMIILLVGILIAGRRN